MSNGFSKWSLAGVAVLSAALVISTGCEWTGGGGVEDWTSRYNFINFSGVYRGVNGGLLVTDYSSEVTTPGTAGTPGSTNNVTGERIGTGDGSSTVFSGTTDHAPVLQGTLTISAGIFSFTDSDGDGDFEATAGASGNFNYTTGKFVLTFPAALSSGQQIVATYSYAIAGSSGTTGSGTGSGPRGNATSGASKKTIFAFTVEQAGNVLRIVDNNGAIYEGNFGDIRSVGGVDQDNSQTTGGVFVPSAGDEFIAQFTAEGVSAAGYKVRMVGTFQAVIARASLVTSGSSEASGGTPTAVSAVLDQRHMLGTWIEEGGRTGNINGEASPITVTP